MRLHYYILKLLVRINRDLFKRYFNEYFEVYWEDYKQDKIVINRGLAKKYYGG